MEFEEGHLYILLLQCTIPIRFSAKDCIISPFTPELVHAHSAVAVATGGHLLWLSQNQFASRAGQ